MTTQTNIARPAPSERVKFGRQPSRTTYYRLININQATSRHHTSAQIAAQPRHIAPPNSAPHHATSYLICKLRAMNDVTLP